MHFKLFLQLFISCALILTSGCASKLTANITPDANTDDLGNIYVARFEPDKRNLNAIIAEELNLLGYNAESGEINDKPNNTDTLVTYTDRWMWDITMYMIAIDMQFFEHI